MNVPGLQAKEPEDPAPGVFIEDPGTVLDIPDIFDGIENIGIFLRDDAHETPEFCPGHDHEYDGNGVGETTLPLVS